MRYVALAAALALGALILETATGEDAPLLGPPLPPHLAPDVQDLVFLGERRPVLLRLHIRVDGKPFQTQWEEYIARLFDYLDRDGDGVLSKEEGERAPSANQLRQAFEGNFFFIFNDGYDRAPFAELDTDPVDGVVTLEEFARYYRRQGAGSLLLMATQGKNAAAEAVTDAIFKLLDTNKDGKLSREEVQAAAVKLLQVDLDDDEMIAPQELVPGRIANQGSQQILNEAHWFLVDPREDKADQLARQLLKKYGKKDKPADSTLDLSRFAEVSKAKPAEVTKLSRSDLGLEQDIFDKLDTNRDGLLGASELGKFLQLPPDIEMHIDIGKSAEEKPPTGPFSWTARPVAYGSRLMTLGNAQIHIRSVDEKASNYDQSQFVRQYLLQQFKGADTDKKGYLEKSKLKSNELQFLRTIFDLADHDGDGKLTEKEVLAYYDLHEAATHCCTALRCDELGQALFEFLDIDRDGRLSQRELRTAWTRLAPWDRDGDGLIAKTELPLQFRLTLCRGPLARRLANPFYTPDANGRPSGIARGPLWFRKMDRNGDGDVSPREFLGTPEEFKRIDTDGDGLIDAEEAERADAWFREPVRK